MTVQPSTSPPLWKLVGSNAAARVLVMVLAGIIGLFTSRIIIGYYGIEEYSQYGLLTQLRNLLPFYDLGLAAVLVNTISGSLHPKTDLQVRHTLTTVFRVLIVFAMGLILVAVLITLGGWWRILLGEGLQAPGGPVALGCLVVFAVSLPLSIGIRVMVAMNQAHKQALSQLIVAPTLLILLGTTAALSLPVGNIIAVFAYMATAAGTLLSFILAVRMIRPQIGAALRDVARIRQVRNVQVWDTALPQLAQMVVIPMAMQTDRLLLSHFGTISQLAQYTLASQLFGMAIQAIIAGGAVLWPFYARARSVNRISSPFRPMFAFLGASAFLSVTLVLAAPWLASVISDNKIELDLWLLGGFMGLVVVQASMYPLGMYLTDPRGLKLQLPSVFIMVPVNLFLSWLLIAWVGAAGPVLGSAISIVVCQLIPYVFLVQADLRKRKREAKLVNVNEESEHNLLAGR